MKKDVPSAVVCLVEALRIFKMRKHVLDAVSTLHLLARIKQKILRMMLQKNNRPVLFLMNLLHRPMIMNVSISCFFFSNTGLPFVKDLTNMIF